MQFLKKGDIISYVYRDRFGEFRTDTLRVKSIITFKNKLTITTVLLSTDNDRLIIGREDSFLIDPRNPIYEGSGFCRGCNFTDIESFKLKLKAKLILATNKVLRKSAKRY